MVVAGLSFAVDDMAEKSASAHACCENSARVVNALQRTYEQRSYITTKEIVTRDALRGLSRLQPG